jgi:hypothetical protein
VGAHPYSRSAPVLQKRIWPSSPRENLEHLAHAAFAFANHGARRRLSMEQALGERQVGIDLVRGTTLVVRLPHDRGHPERRAHREPDKKRRIQRQDNMNLVNAEAQRVNAPRGEEQGQQHGHRKEPTQQDRAGILLSQQAQGGRLVDRERDTQRQQLQAQGGVQLHARSLSQRI